MAVGPVVPLRTTRLEGPAAPREVSRADRPDFGNHLLDSLEQARTSETQAEDMAERFAQSDPDVGIHEVMIATEQAQVSLRYAVTLKNKAIEAYRELMNTPL